MAYNQENFRRIRDQLAARRTHAEATAEDHRHYFHAMSPEAAEIDRALGRTSMRLFEIACRPASPEKDKALDDLRRENLSLQQARRDLLRHLGLPEDYTDPHYTCPVCRDTGYTDTGAMCACFKKALTMEAFRSGGIGHLADRQSFDNFSLDYYKEGAEREQMRCNLTAAREYAETFLPGRSGNLLMLGPTGLGKTHLSTAIARRVIERGFDVRYESAQNIISAYEHDRFHSGRGDTEFQADSYEHCELLIMDDLGTEFQTSFSLSCLYNLINTRLNRGLPTVISTNLSAADIRSRYDDRIASRLLGHFRPLVFAGSDIRYQKL